MKKSILILFAVVVASVNMLAQNDQPQRPKKTPEERAEMMTQRMTKELSLTTDQQTKIKAMMLKRAQDRDAQVKESKENREKAENELKSILTPEQYQVYQQKREEKKTKYMNKQPAPSAPDQTPTSNPQPK